MEYMKANETHIDTVFQLVQKTIKTIYPKYYPKEVVDFFCQLHNRKNIATDIKNGGVGILLDDMQIVGTGSCKENHITRVYVLPKLQGQGYGSYIMQTLENEIAKKYDRVYLDASLPASKLYEHRGYNTISHETWTVENDVVLVYEVMEKQLPSSDSFVCYEGRIFVPKFNTENGEVDNRTVFSYHQNKNILWADYSGGEVIKGSLIGTVAKNGELDFYYQHMNIQGQVKVGKCHSVPTILDNGKIELYEEWQWLNGDKSKGSSIITEK